MAIRFTDSTHRHFCEDRLDEAMVLRAMGEPVWTAIVDRTTRPCYRRRSGIRR